jgi:nitrite reductase/ring-hydroxylating ferredoxin subunit
MNWVKLVNQQDLPEGTRLLEKADGREVLLINHQGRIYALQSRCTHMGGPLVKGKVTEEGLIVCPWHHSAFSLETGEVQEWAPWPPVVGPVLGAIREHRPLQTFPVRVEDGSIWIGMAESEGDQ